MGLCSIYYFSALIVLPECSGCKRFCLRRFNNNDKMDYLLQRKQRHNYISKNNASRAYLRYLQAALILQHSSCVKNI